MTALTQMSGLELLRAFTARPERPPGIDQLIGLETVTVEHGRVEFAVTTRPDFANPLGSVHGGICATLLDSAMSCAVHSTLDAGQSYSTIEIKINYTGAVSTAGKRLTATGTTLHIGRTIATAEGKVHDEDGRLVAHGTTTCHIVR